MTRDLPTEHQLAVALRVLGEARRDHVVVSLSGAHAYGFPSPDSDLDLKAIHVEPTERLLGLSAPPSSFDRAEVIDGVEIDYTSNELGPVLHGLLAGNGNYLERVLGATPLVASPLLEELRPLARGAISRRYHRHYRGFAHSQRQALEARPTAKKALYVLRTALTGAHLLSTGELVTDVRQLLEPYGFTAATELIDLKQRAERVELAASEHARWGAELERALTVLDQAEARSALPEEPQGRAELEAWLVATRRARLG